MTCPEPQTLTLSPSYSVIENYEIRNYKYINIKIINKYKIDYVAFGISKNLIDLLPFELLEKIYLFRLSFAENVYSVNLGGNKISYPKTTIKYYHPKKENNKNMVLSYDAKIKKSNEKYLYYHTKKEFYKYMYINFKSRFINYINKDYKDYDEVINNIRFLFFGMLTPSQFGKFKFNFFIHFTANHPLISRMLGDIEYTRRRRLTPIINL